MGMNLFKRNTAPGPAAIAAATWWASQLGVIRTNGTDDGMSAMFQILAQAQRPTDSADVGERFAGILAAKVQSELDRLTKIRPDFDVTLDVDYGPDRILGDAADQAGVRGGFPMKTTMWVRTDYVTVSAGYQAESVLVWASDEWLAARPTCNSQKWDEGRPYSDDYHGEPWACSLPIYHEERRHQYDRPLAMCVDCGRTERSGYHDEDRDGWTGRVHAFRAAVPAVEV
jgi:hypothetical protein